MQNFVHLNVHSEYTIMNAITKLSDIIDKTRKLSMNYVCLSDINNMFACYTFEKICKKANSKVTDDKIINNLIGVTFCIKGIHDDGFYTLTLIAKNVNGYRNIANLSTLANTGNKKFPFITLDELSKYVTDCICLTGGNSGELFKLVNTKQYDNSREYLNTLITLFSKENLFIELTNHFIPEEKEFLDNPFVSSIAKELDIDFVATNHVYYLDREHSFHRAIALEMNPNPDGITLFSKYVNYNDEFYLKSVDEMNEAFKDYFDKYPNMFENTLKIAKECANVKVPIERALPEFPLPEGYTSETYLKKLIWDGFNKRFPDDSFFADGFSRKDYEDRLNYEYNTIVTMGFTDYFLIVQDFINFAKDAEVYKHPETYFPTQHFDLKSISDELLNKNFEISVGPGRGSAAGSLMAYVLSITERLDPIKNTLLFERFLNIERVSMPDIDIDFSNAHRYFVVQYVQEKYQYSHVAQIVTFQTMQAKKVIKSVGKALGLPFFFCNEMTDNIPFCLLNEKGEEVPPTLSKIKELEYFKNLLADNETVNKLFKLGEVLEGIPSATSKHAAGVIIGRQQLNNYLPLMEVDGVMVTQFEKGNCEEIGLLKMDFLGLRTLDILEKTRKLVKEIHNVSYSTNSIPENDEKTYELLRGGNTRKVFQIESDGMIDLFKKMKPTNFEDINAAIALYRPGPMQFIPKYLEGRANPSLINYPHPLFKEVTKATFGILVYQEQIMQVVQKLAGFTLGHADILRKAISKKQKDIVAKEKELFIQGCKTVNNIPEKQAREIFEQIEPFADYGFNRSHSAAYGIVAYDTAFFKANYPECFMAANLTVSSQDAKDLAYILAECKKNNIQILPPDYKKSETEFIVEKMPDKSLAIRYAYAAITGIGENMANEYSKIKTITSLGDYISKLPSALIKTAQLTSLINAGTFDAFGSRREMIESLPSLIEFVKTKNLFNSIQLPNFLDLLKFKTKYSSYEYSQNKKLEFERKAINVSLSGHPLESVRTLSAEYNVNLADIQFHPQDFADCTINILCLLKDMHVIQTKKGLNMAFLNVEDEFQNIEGIVFPKDYKKIEHDLAQLENTPVILTGKVQIKETEAENLDQNISSQFKCSIIISDVKKAIKNNYRLYLDQSTINQPILNQLSSFNGIVNVVFIDTVNKQYTLSPFMIDLNDDVTNILESNKVTYHVWK